MLNAIITANDQTAIIEFPIDQFDLYKQLGQIGIRKGPHKIALTDDEDAEIQVKLYADNDFGNHVIRLFHERDTLDDVHTAVGAMEYKAEFAITLPEDLLDALGIDEDTLFEAYYDDGKIKVRILDEEALEDEFEDDDEDFDDEEIDVPEECAECPHFCWHCGVCTLDE